VIDHSTIKGLDEVEREQAELMLMTALEKKFDRRWVWGLGELGTESAYEFLMNLYNEEEVAFTKVNYAYTLILMNTKAPVLEYLQGILNSKEHIDIRKRALGALYWLYDKPFDDKVRHQLYLSILFDAMADRTKDIRLNAYDILKDHYGMKPFTALDDPVLKTISAKRKKTAYQRAAQLFENRIRSVEVAPLSRKAVVQWIKSLPNSPPTTNVADCEICSTIPDNLEADIAKGESLGGYTSKLETAIKFAYYSNAVKRCPVCGRLYIYRYHYEFLVGWSSEEDEYLSRTDTKGAIQLVDSFLESYDFKQIITCGNFLKLSY
jgi:hypothetical protein